MSHLLLCPPSILPLSLLPQVSLCSFFVRRASYLMAPPSHYKSKSRSAGIDFLGAVVAVWQHPPDPSYRSPLPMASHVPRAHIDNCQPPDIHLRRRDVTPPRHNKNPKTRKGVDAASVIPPPICDTRIWPSLPSSIRLEAEKGVWRPKKLRNPKQRAIFRGFRSNNELDRR